jgi:hypothetical protein
LEAQTWKIFLQKRSERNRTLGPTKTNPHADARTDDKKRAKKRSRLNAKKMLTLVLRRIKKKCAKK